MLLAKRLERGPLVWPQAECGSVQVRDAEIEMLRPLVQKLELQLARRNRVIGVPLRRSAA